MEIKLNNIADGYAEMPINDYVAGIYAKKEMLTQSTVKYSYLFSKVSAKRFQVYFEIPHDAINAFVSLNGKKLLGFFSPDLPLDAFIPVEAKNDLTYGSKNNSHDTTLAPGRSQMISFRWIEGDELSFYIFYNISEVSGQR